MNDKREWLVIEATRKYGVFADTNSETDHYIPRDVAETLLGRELSGAQWFTKEESKIMRAHPEWCDKTPAEENKEDEG